MTELYLIRHAKSMGNLKQLFQGRVDMPLCPEGEEQLEKLALRCRDIPFDIVYSSPLERAFKTALAVCRFHDLQPVTDPELIEISVGEWEGKPLAWIRENFPAQFECWYETPHLYQAPGGEAMSQVRERMSRAVLRILGENEGKTVGIVSHGCAIWNFLSFASGQRIEEMKSLKVPGNTSLSHIIMDEAGRLKVDYMADAKHIGQGVSQDEDFSR
ncbi:MAG: histidine phosphatase family protein [Oscillospiraceae bacterium]|nr:histidine phosphatase family protein [Oscillospiraceae bacterium]